MKESARGNRVGKHEERQGSLSMNISSAVTDSITELLSKVMEFTKRRRELISANILNVNEPGYQPKDLDVEEFAGLMAQAISEYLQSQRLLLCDGRHTYFLENGRFATVAVVDQEAARLRALDSKTYLQEQMGKLFENVLNGRLAEELLATKQHADSGGRYL